MHTKKEGHTRLDCSLLNRAIGGRMDAERMRCVDVFYTDNNRVYKIV
jgi:hypothetical protein